MMTTNYFCDQIQNVIDQTLKAIIVVQGDWNAKARKDVYENWQGICSPFCYDETNERGLRLLQFATFNDLVLANTSQDGPGIAQMDKVDIKKSTTTSRGA